MSSTEKEKVIGITRKTVYVAVAVILVAGLSLGAFLGAFDGLVRLFQGEEIVATVNGEEVAREDFALVLEQQKMQYLMQGIDFDSEEMSGMLEELEHHVLDNYFIIPILLRQKAEESIIVSEAEINERYQEYVDAFGGEEQLEEQLLAANMSREELDEEIIEALLIENYLDSYVDSYLENHPEERIDEDMPISGDEIEEYYEQLRETYDQLKELLEEEDPAMPLEQVEMQLQLLEEQYADILEADHLDEIRPRLEEMMRREKVEQERKEQEEAIFMAHIEELKEESEIQKFI